MWAVLKLVNEDTRTTSVMSFWCFCCQLWAQFTPSSGASVVDFEHVNTYIYICIIIESPIIRVVAFLHYPSSLVLGKVDSPSNFSYSLFSMLPLSFCTLSRDNLCFFNKIIVNGAFASATNFILFINSSGIGFNSYHYCNISSRIISFLWNALQELFGSLTMQ